MITALDTSVLLDVFGADPKFGPRSRQALSDCYVEGSLVACDVVWAELAASFPATGKLTQAMHRLSVAFSPLDVDACLEAGEAWRAYRKRGGHRARVIADFLIGAHAARHADRLLTRDRGFYRAYFRRLKLVDPTAT